MTFKIESKDIQLVDTSKLVLNPKINAKVFIPLSGKNGQGLVTSVDLDDYIRLSLNNRKINVNNGYARVGKEYLHRIVTENKWDLVDHKDINRLNNCKENLRQSSYAKNLANTFYTKEKSKGVYKQDSGLFRAAIVIDKKYISLGTYETEREASAAYNAACIIVYKDHHRGS